MRRLTMLNWAVSAGLAWTMAWGMLVSMLGAADPLAVTPAPRRYSDGPLTAKDFVTPPPKPRPKISDGSFALANTFVEVNYTYRYQTEERGARRHAYATEADCHATLSLKHSWNSAPNDKWLMAHEQGHFDLGEIYAWRAQARLDKLIAARAITASGATEEEALKALAAAVEAEFAKAVADMNAEHKQYDRDTRHGLDGERQSQWRRKLDEQLDEAAKGRAARKPGT